MLEVTGIFNCRARGESNISYSVMLYFSLIEIMYNIFPFYNWGCHYVHFYCEVFM